MSTGIPGTSGSTSPATTDYVRPELTAPQYMLNQTSGGEMQEEDLF